MSFYGHDLAHAHDVGFDFIARGAAPAIVTRLRNAGIDRGLIVELGCGSGIAARVFTDAGYDAWGVDVSADMLAIARERAPAATFVQGSLHDVELPRCAAVVAMGEILNYAGIGDALFARVRGALAPGGLFVFDAAAPGREQPEPRRSWHEGDGWVVCVEAREDPDARRLTRRIATFTARAGDDGLWARSDELHELKLYEPGELLRALSAAGFEDARVVPEGYGPGVAMPAALPVYVARAPAG